MRRSKYNQEFKDSALKLWIDSNKSFTIIARDLGLNKGTLSLWVSKYKDSNNLTSGSKISKESLEEENKRLKKACNSTIRTKYLKKGNGVLCKKTISKSKNETKI